MDDQARQQIAMLASWLEQTNVRQITGTVYAHGPRGLEGACALGALTLSAGCYLRECQLVALFPVLTMRVQNPHQDWRGKVKKPKLTNYIAWLNDCLELDFADIAAELRKVELVTMDEPTELYLNPSSMCYEDISGDPAKDDIKKLMELLAKLPAPPRAQELIAA